jgi:hypothetical protein
VNIQALRDTNEAHCRRILYVVAKARATKRRAAGQAGHEEVVRHLTIPGKEEVTQANTPNSIVFEQNTQDENEKNANGVYFLETNDDTQKDLLVFLASAVNERRHAWRDLSIMSPSCYG